MGYYSVNLRVGSSVVGSALLRTSVRKRLIKANLENLVRSR